LKRLIVAILLALFLSPLLPEQSAFAACANPAGNAGDMIYNRDAHAPTYCNGAVWVNTSGSRRYIPNTVFLDGNTNNVIKKTTNLTGAVAGGIVTGSFWFQTTGRFGSVRNIFTIYSAANARFAIMLNTSNVLQITGYNSSATKILDISGSTAITDSKWHHAAFSLNLAASQVASSNPAIYLDEVAETLTVTTFTNDNIDFAPTTTPQSSIGWDQPAAPPFVGALVNFWLNPTFVDLSVTANRRYFIDATKMPVNMGTTGSGGPTGAAPLIYLSANGATWRTNQGTGGGFTNGGTSTAAAYGPTATVPTVTRLNEITDATNLKNAAKIAVNGSYAYVTTNNNRLGVVNISNPSSLALGTSLNNASLTTSAYGIVVDGSYAYVAGKQVISTINLTTPSVPTYAASFANNYICSQGNTCSLTKYKNDIYADDRNLHILTALDASNPLSLAVLSPTTPFSTSVTSNTVGAGPLTFTTQTGLSYAAGQIIIIIDQASPLNYMHCLIGSYNSGTGALVTSGTTLCTTGGSGTKTAWNIYMANADNDVADGDGIGEGSDDLLVDNFTNGKYLYSSYYEDGLTVLDISNPASPVVLGGDDNVPSGTSGVLSQNPLTPNIIYQADNGYGGDAVIMDVTNKTAPVQGSGSGAIGGADIVGAQAAIWWGNKIQNNRLFAVNNYTTTPHIAVYDISTATAPKIVATSGTAACTSCYDLAVSGNYLYTTEKTATGGVVSWQYADGGTCSSPAGNEGDLMYNAAAYHVLQFCDGTNWKALGPVPGAGGGGCSSPAGSEGDVIYNNVSGVMQYCDGLHWHHLHTSS
jgi:hypothetical protein